MALAANALTTVSAVRAELGAAYCDPDFISDEVLERYVNEASALFETWTNSKWYYKAGHVERVPGYATDVLRVRDFVPVVALTSVEFDYGETSGPIDSDLYELIDDKRIWRRAGVWRDTRRVEFGITARRVAGSAAPLYLVTYDGGYITPQQEEDGVGTRTLPYDVEGAVMDFIAMKANQRGTDTSIRRLEMDDGVIEWNRTRIPQTFYNAVMARQTTEVA